jgi:hypothetical protein
MKLTGALAGAIAILLVCAPSSIAGQEIADLTKGGPDRRGPTDVLLASGTNPIGPEAFETYTPPPGYLKNTERSAEFNDQKNLSSPGVPEPELTNVTTPDDYTWIVIARTRSFMWPFRPAQWREMRPRPDTGWKAAFVNPTPPEGTVRYSANSKNQIMYFWAREGNAPDGAPIKRYFVTDRWGNRFIMMSSGAATPADKDAAFQNAVLPAGFKKSTGFLKKTLAAKPAYDLQDTAQYNIWRDSGDNSWVQIGWSRNGGSIAQQIGDSMPIWGGRTGDRLRGTNGDDVFHGAQGNDTFIPMRGNDLVHGDAGKANTVRLPGRRSQYRVVRRSGSSVTLASPFGRKQLNTVQRVRYGNGKTRRL